MNFFVQKNRGSSLLEVILAIALFGFLCSALVSMSLGGFSSLRQGGEYSQAEAYAQQGIEAVRAIRDSAWNKIVYSNSAVTSTGNAWQFVGENTSSTFGKYLRTINFANVCRGVSNNITNCPGSYTDLNSKLVTVNVSWLSEHGATNNIQKISYLTNWESRDWTQTDWSGGTGQSIWLLTNKYDSDDGNVDVNTVGEIKLKHLIVVNQQQYDWTFTTTSDFTYNLSKIVVSSSTARLVDQGGSGSCSGTATVCSAFVATSTCQAQGGCAWGGSASGNTINPDFSSTLNPWTSGSWGTACTRSRATSGGNPTAYAKIQFPSAKSATSGGYFQQSFVATGAASIATLDLDWIVSQYTGAAQNLTLYAFVDTVAGTPTIGNAAQVWSSGNQTAVTAWNNPASIDIASKITGAGTYYLKIAAFVTYASGGSNRQYAVGFDNVQLNWSKANVCSGTPTACNTFAAQPNCQAQSGCLWNSIAVYPTDKPTINPVVVYSVTTSAWSVFTESAVKNGGEIYYQLSSDGTIWKYWNGSAWAVVGASNYNIASIINTNIATFPTSTGKIMFKAFLSSNGSQQVILDNVRVGWGENVESGYVTTGNFLSSAFDMSNVSPVQILAWDQNISGCGSCNVKLQLRTAPDNSGSPGVWTGWYGADGVGTYFTDYLGTLLPTSLNGNQWVQYRAELAGDDVGTPILQEVRVNYK